MKFIVIVLAALFMLVGGVALADGFVSVQTLQFFKVVVFAVICALPAGMRKLFSR